MKIHAASYFPYLLIFYILEGAKFGDFSSIAQLFSHNSEFVKSACHYCATPSFETFRVQKNLQLLKSLRQNRSVIKPTVPLGNNATKGKSVKYKSSVKLHFPKSNMFSSHISYIDF